MTIEVKLPALSATMEKGTLAKWLVKEGDVISPGDMLAEVETDKATMELESDEGGRVMALLVPGGTEDVQVGTVIAVLGAADGRAPTASVEAPNAAQVQSIVPEPKAVTEAPAPEPETAASVAPERIPVPTLDHSINATPLSLRLASINDIDLTRISGSGPNGKIVRRDLGLAFPIDVSTPQPTAMSAVAPITPTHTIAPPPAGVPVTTEKLSTMHRTIARRLSESKQTVPHFYLTARCNLDPLLRLRSQLNADLASRGIKLSVNDLLVKALAIALMREPSANVQFGGDSIHQFSRVDISMAVAIDGGLVTPVLCGVEGLSLSAISALSKSLAEKARTGKLTPEEYQGGTASISNLGMFGIDEMFPVINPPQALILGIGAGIEQPWNVDGQIGLATVMSATASFDHRVIDGAIAARFMAAFKEVVERPLALLA